MKVKFLKSYVNTKISETRSVSKNSYPVYLEILFYDCLLILRSSQPNFPLHYLVGTCNANINLSEPSLNSLL